MTRLPAILLLLLPLAGCSGFSDSRANPSNWFSGDRPHPTLEPEDGYAPTAVDTRQLVSEVTELRVEPTLGGIIVRATGLPPSQGYWDAELVPAQSAAASTLTYEFRVRQPTAPAPQGPARSRQVEVAAFVSDMDLSGVSRITVNAGSNSRSRSR